ncbi:G_PROTEIN_RECEP_F1_2 domain-containing protein [Meloidogyne graminicola]|uniref:G_PROTEIN_RECEP_F1_2 domain-containing protein n=1 Tax=Meloidogyne graminicola TaxID=189291 RepID=A0A8S9ZIP7_9BILA|nr:G_PROTEIN_RECEP_F1_2 domain-containing protein [Meloidogyne graminicola]
MLEICKIMMESNDFNSKQNILLQNNSKIQEADHVHLSKLNFITYMIIAPIIISISIIGDILTIITLNHPTMRRKKRYLYFFVLFGTNRFVYTIISYSPILWILNFRHCSKLASFYYAHIAFPFSNALMGASVWVVILMTLYQFKAVCYPLHSQTIQTQRKFIYLLFLVIYLCNFCIYAPWSQKKIVYKVPNGILRCPFLVCDNLITTPLFGIYEWFREFLTRFFPFFLLAYFNINILIAYRNNKRDRLTSLSNPSLHKKAMVEKSEKEERRLFTLLFLITIVFFVCTIPAAPLTILISNKQDNSLPFQIYRSLANLLEITKFALNFYFYCLINPDICHVCLTNSKMPFCL